MCFYKVLQGPSIIFETFEIPENIEMCFYKVLQGPSIIIETFENSWKQWNVFTRFYATVKTRRCWRYGLNKEFIQVGDYDIHQDRKWWEKFDKSFFWRMVSLKWEMRMRRVWNRKWWKRFEKSFFWRRQQRRSPRGQGFYRILWWGFTITFSNYNQGYMIITGSVHTKLKMNFKITYLIT